MTFEVSSSQEATAACIEEKYFSCSNLSHSARISGVVLSTLKRLRRCCLIVSSTASSKILARFLEASASLSIPSDPWRRAYSWIGVVLEVREG